MPLLVVIADDLTGANDTGLQFLKAGLRTVVALGPHPRPLSQGERGAGDVLVVNTQSRALPAEEASRLAADAARRYPGHMLYKKIDSTARGLWGVELSAVMAASGNRLALATPALPAQQRTVRGGRVLLDGVPLERTSLAHDPTFPMRESYLPALLAEQGISLVSSITLPMLEAGPEALAHQLRHVAGVAIFDAETDAHLQIIARAAALLQPTPLLCGSAGLAAALPAAFGWAAQIVPARPAVAGSVLIAASSRNPVTLQQCEAADAAGIALWRLSPAALAEAPAAASLCEQVAGHLAGGRPAIVALDAAEPSLSGRWEPVAANLARTARDIIRRGGAGAAVFTGGDIAYAFCQLAGVVAVRLADEILPAIPAGVLLGGELDGLPIATKAGGFGALDALVRIVRYFEQES